MTSSVLVYSSNPALRRPSINSFKCDCLRRPILADIVKVDLKQTRRRLTGLGIASEMGESIGRYVRSGKIIHAALLLLMLEGRHKRTSFHHQPEAQHPKIFSYPQAGPADYPIFVG
jgi:hypothetical protein